MPDKWDLRKKWLVWAHGPRHSSPWQGRHDHSASTLVTRHLQSESRRIDAGASPAFFSLSPGPQNHATHIWGRSSNSTQSRYVQRFVTIIILDPVKLTVNITIPVLFNKHSSSPPRSHSIMWCPVLLSASNEQGWKKKGRFTSQFITSNFFMEEISFCKKKLMNKSWSK